MKITLEGNPLSTNSLYRHHGNIVYMTKEGKELKRIYQWQGKTQLKGFKCLTGALEITVALHFGDKRVRDIDNYSKILLDSLSGIVWKDDRQIQRMVIEKFIDKNNPRTELEITTI